MEHESYIYVIYIFVAYHIFSTDFLRNRHTIISVTLSILTSAAPSFPSFLFENKLNNTERGEADVNLERVTDITS